MPPEPAGPLDQEEPPAPTPEIVIGIGASAGGVGALRQFFMRVPEAPKAAFVVVLHLSPDHESRLPEVLAAITPLPVVRVTQRTSIEPGRIYVVPPNRSLTIEDGHIAVAPLTTPEQRYAPVDLLLRSLAKSHRTGAVAVILSGTGANGSNGVKWIKEHGGLVVVQDPAEAEFPDMPRNSIATGLVDYQLAVEAMPEAIFRYYSQHLPPPPLLAAADTQDAERDALRELLTLLRVKTGHDFSNYKPGTVYRRIARRMHVHNLSTTQDYVQFMRDSSDEAALLLNELLISVTSFFRDPEAYKALRRRVIPRLFEHKHTSDQVRVWVAGCATGEEAYSIAMLLAEFESMRTGPSVQLFATDLDVRAIAIGREGFYTDAEVADVTEERLRRFFLREGTGYRVRRDLRETVLFAHHNLIKDPPFSHLDLVVCRNVMIYLNRAAQRRLAEAFHFALRPGGYLFLGSSETLDNANDLFTTLDRPAHIYESRTVARRVSSATPDEPMLLAPRVDPLIPRPRAADRQSASDLHQRLLEQYAPPSLVVTEDYQVVHISDSAARYLALSGGEPTRDLLKMVRRELRVDLRTAMHQALRQRTTVEVRGIVLADPDRARLTISVKPALREGDPPRGYLLVLFAPEPDQPPPDTAGVRLDSPAEAPVAQLEAELEHAKRQMSATIEDYESHAEEMRAANEELQAMNEELRSAAEELETSKEELQSVNEELTTVNQELKIKIEELAHTNNDFQNFINATDVGTLFLDRGLRVKLFTARATDLFHLLGTDIGRPLAHIASTLRGEQLEQDLGAVMERLQPIEREVQAENGRCYLMRLLPYRTSDDRIDGIVISFIDITTRVRAEQAVKLGEQRLRLLIDGAVEYAIFTVTLDGTIDFWNAGAQRMFGYVADEAIGHSAAMLRAPDSQEPPLEAQLGAAKSQARVVVRETYVRKDGTRVECSGEITRLGEGTELGFAWTVRDLTAQIDAADALARANAGLEQRVASRTRELTAEVQRRTEAQNHVTKLMQTLVTSQEEQRARIARDLHDQLGQQLTALRLALERFRDRQDTSGAPDADLDRALALTHQIDTEVDFLAWELRPAMLDDLGLAAALPQFVRDWSAHYGIATEVRTSGLNGVHPPREVEVTFYRVAQEALNNIVKHAHASRADVILEMRDGSLVLVVEDDGVGFDTTGAEPAHGIGLLGMRERASLIGATLDVESTPGHGTSVFLRCPLAGNADRQVAV